MMIILCDASVTGSMTASFTYHVAVELSGGVAAVAGAIGLGDGLRHAGVDQTSPVNQTDKEESQSHSEEIKTSKETRGPVQPGQKRTTPPSWGPKLASGSSNILSLVGWGSLG